ncbi:hypothetical protein ACFL45_08840 [Candidatus Neomarinimicrobiota bacterium]
MTDLVRQYITEFWWVTALSVGLVVTFFVVIPMLILQLPVDYIVSMDEQPHQGPKKRSFSRLLLGLVKNLIGIVLVFIGIALLVLPGEGIITIIIGLLLIDFPGKFKFKCWLLKQPLVINSINWLRIKSGRPKLRVPLPGEAANCPE